MTTGEFDTSDNTPSVVDQLRNQLAQADTINGRLINTLNEVRDLAEIALDGEGDLAQAVLTVLKGVPRKEEPEPHGE